MRKLSTGDLDGGDHDEDSVQDAKDLPRLFHWEHSEASLIGTRRSLQVTSIARWCAVKKSKKARRDPVSPFRDKLWNLFQELAKGIDGADVVIALKQAGEEIWAVGIDDTYSSMSQQDQDAEPIGNVFDITWLTVVCIKLKEMKQGKKPKVRIHS
jgi:hypothetical protein